MKKQQVLTQEQAGFTIIELLIATVVFALILVVITSGVIRFTQDYYKGLHQSTTQTTMRDVVNLLSQSLQYGGGTYSEPQQLPPDNNNGAICIGTTQINYHLGFELNVDSGDNYGLVVTTKDPVAGCKRYVSGQGGRELLAPKTRLTNLSVTPSGTKTYSIAVGATYGDLDLLCARSLPSSDAGGCDPAAAQIPNGFSWVSNGALVGCKGGPGAQFCAQSHLTTQVVSRF